MLVAAASVAADLAAVALRHAVGPCDLR
jgi:hypothetical protein